MVKQRRNPFIQGLPRQPPDFYDHLKVAEKRTRNRQWEKRHQSQKAMYRGVDPQVALQVKRVANGLKVRDGELARALLEYGLGAYVRGELVLNSRPDPTRLRMTLYPDRETRAKSYHQKHLAEPNWRVVTTWRSFPPELKQEIAELASEEGLNVPAGELVTALLRYSLKAYEYGLLKLEPVAVVSGYALLEG